MICRRLVNSWAESHIASIPTPKKELEGAQDKVMKAIIAIRKLCTANV